MGLPVMSEVIQVTPGWVKLMIFLFLFPVIGGMVMGIFFDANSYMCDGKGEVYVIDLSALNNGDALWSGITGVASRIESIINGFLTPILNLITGGESGQTTQESWALSTLSPKYNALQSLRKQIVGITKGNSTHLIRTEEIRSDYICSVMDTYCMNYTAGRMLNSTEFVSEYGNNYYYSLYGYCNQLSPYTSEDSNISILLAPNLSSSGGCFITYTKANATKESLLTEYNTIVHDIGYRYTGGFETQIFPVKCDRTLLKPQVTLLSIPIFNDIRTMIMLYVVYYLSMILVTVKSFQNNK